MNSNDFYALCKSRRSTRLFRDEPVPPDVLRRIIEPGLEAPTACNRQLWEVAIVTDPDVKKRMSKHGDANVQSYLYDAPALLALFYDTRMESRNPCYTPYVTMGMMAHGILLAAEAEGLGAIYLGGIQNPAGMARALDAPEHLRNLGVICVGYRDDDPPEPPRRSFEEVTHWNTLKGLKKKCHPDIRPHVWSLDQLGDFREKVLWYKGVAFDAKTLHSNPDQRFSKRMQYFCTRAGQLIGRYPVARVLDVMPHNGDTVLQTLQMMPTGIEKLFVYELTSGTLQFIKERLDRLLDCEQVEFLLNPGTECLRIPLEDGAVDAVLCYERPGQFDDPLPLLKEIRRVLRPGGSALLSVSNRWYPHLTRYKRSWRKNYALGVNWNYGPARMYAPGSIRQKIEEAGLRVTSSVGFIPAESTIIRRLIQWSAKTKGFNLSDRLANLFCQYRPVSDWRKSFCNMLVYEVVKGSHD